MGIIRQIWRRFDLQEKWLKPMGFGRILDRSFQIYRNMFVKLLLLVLILYCPFYLLEGIFYSQSASNSLTLDLSNLQKSMTEPAVTPVIDTSNVAMYILIFIVLGIVMIALFPIAVAAVLFMVESINKGKAVGIGEVLSRAFKRFWALLGSTIVYSLIIFGITLVFVIALTIVVAITAIVGLQGFSTESFMNPAGAVGLIIGFIVIYLMIYILLGFFAIRWGFYLPFVALKEEGVGIERSWKLTKGSFWRIFAILFTITVIIYALVLVASLLLGLMQGSVLKAVLLVLINVIVSPLFLVVYAVTFFDLRVRTEGSDLESMLLNTNINSDIRAQVESIEGHD
jgi:hypothetical protein